MRARFQSSVALRRVAQASVDACLVAVAYFLAHAPKSFFPALNGGEAAILFCFGFLYLVFSGPGAVSLDTLLARNSGDRAEVSGVPQEA